MATMSCNPTHDFRSIVNDMQAVVISSSSSSSTSSSSSNSSSSSSSSTSSSSCKLPSIERKDVQVSTGASTSTVNKITFILDAFVVGFAQLKLSANKIDYEFIVEVYWSTGLKTFIKRTFDDFVVFDQALRNATTVPNVAGRRLVVAKAMTQLPSLNALKKRFWMSHLKLAEMREIELNTYVDKLLKLPIEVAHSRIVSEFFASQTCDPKSSTVATTTTTTTSSSSSSSLSSPSPQPAVSDLELIESDRAESFEHDLDFNDDEDDGHDVVASVLKKKKSEYFLRNNNFECNNDDDDNDNDNRHEQHTHIHGELDEFDSRLSSELDDEEAEDGDDYCEDDYCDDDDDENLSESSTSSSSNARRQQGAASSGATTAKGSNYSLACGKKKMPSGGLWWDEDNALTQLELTTPHMFDYVSPPVVSSASCLSTANTQTHSHPTPTPPPQSYYLLTQPVVVVDGVAITNDANNTSSNNSDNDNMDDAAFLRPTPPPLLTLHDGQEQI